MLFKPPHLSSVECPPPSSTISLPIINYFIKHLTILSYIFLVVLAILICIHIKLISFIFGLVNVSSLVTRLRTKIINVYMSPVVVFPSTRMLCLMSLPFLFSLLCPLSPFIPTPLPPILISTSLLPSIVSVLSSHAGPTIDFSSPPPPSLHTLSLPPPPAPADESSFSSSLSSASPSPPPIRTYHIVTRAQNNIRTPKV